MVDKSPELVFVTEKDRLYPYMSPFDHFQDIVVSDNRLVGRYRGIGPQPQTYEGFHESQARQFQIGLNLAELFNFKERGVVLDVGWGSNKFIAQGISLGGAEVSLLDFNDFDLVGVSNEEREQHLPREIAPVEGKFKRYIGDVRNIRSNGSDLKNTQFGAVMFNGSWVAGLDGDNWTVAWRAENSFLKRDQALLEAKRVLNEQGVLYIGSSRYANIGAGYTFFHLPVEKAEFLDLAKWACNVGARKITVLGMNGESLQKRFENTMNEDVIDNLPERYVFRDSNSVLVNRLKVSGKEIIEAMTGGIEGLPTVRLKSVRINKRIAKVLQSITENVARIDGFAIEL